MPPIAWVLLAATVGGAIGFKNGLKVGGATGDMENRAGLAAAVVLAAAAAGGGFLFARRFAR